MKKIFKDFITAIRGTEKEFTSGSVNRAIFMLSIPMILEMAMESLFAVVDIYFVGKVSTDAVTTVGYTETVLTLIYAVAIGMSMAATAMVARRIGENKPREAAAAAMQVIYIGVAVSVIMGFVGVIFAADILRLMGGAPQLIASGLTYTRIMFGSNIVILLLFLLNAVFRGAGDASIAMRALWLANGLNLILDPILIFGLGPFPELGLQGAAIATSIGRGTAVLYQISVLFGKKSIIKITRHHMPIRLHIIRRLLTVSAGGVWQFLIASGSWILLMRIISEFGSQIVAGYVFAIRIIIFTILPSWGMANAAATLVGQNLGANQPERAELSVWRTAFLNMIFLFAISIIFFFGARPIIGFFTSDPEVLEAGITSLRILCAGYIFFAYGMVIGQAYNGAGDTYTPTLVNFICFWAIQTPLAYALALPLSWGPPGVYWAIAISESILAIIFILLFRQGRWKLVKI